jgi:hypothetical protein
MESGEGQFIEAMRTSLHSNLRTAPLVTFEDFERSALKGTPKAHFSLVSGTHLHDYE